MHWTAALKHILSPNNRPTKVSAFTVLPQKHLGPVDTLQAIIQTHTGISGLFGYSAGVEHKPPGKDFEVVCRNGSVSIALGTDVGIVTMAEAGKDLKVKEFDSKLYSRYELETFVRSILEGKEQEGEKPEAALDDLILLQRMLESCAEGGIVKTVAFSAA